MGIENMKRAASTRIWGTQVAKMIQPNDMPHSYSAASLFLVISGFMVPVLVSLLRFLPFPRFLLTKFNAWVIDPPLWGKRHKQPAVWGLGLVPTRGQAIFIAYLILLNLVLLALGIHSAQPTAWNPEDAIEEILGYTTNRLGALSFANIPLLFLYAGRNNVLIRLTNWNHNTFLLLHRWVAYIATTEGALHSLIWLRIYIQRKEYNFESKLPYWYWGVIATISMASLIITSLRPVRHRIYEFFLAWHVLVSALVLTGCYLHIFYRFGHRWGYETWVIAAMAIWAFDRLVRLVRVACNGFRTALVTVIDDDYVRIDVPNLSGDGHAYLYFPTLTWRMWENHPFSFVSNLSQGASSNDIQDIEKATTTAITAVVSKDLDITALPRFSLESDDGGDKLHRAAKSSTFFVRTKSGLTAKLRSHSTLKIFVEPAPCQHVNTADYPFLLCIAGGVGLSAVLPYIHRHPGVKKLYWGVRSGHLVRAAHEFLQGVDKDIVTGGRINLKRVIEESLDPWGSTGVAVVVCGPPEMVDNVRVLVAAFGRRKGRMDIRLIDEALHW